MTGDGFEALWGRSFAHEFGAIEVLVLDNLLSLSDDFCAGFESRMDREIAIKGRLPFFPMALT